MALYHDEAMTGSLDIVAVEDTHTSKCLARIAGVVEEEDIVLPAFCFRLQDPAAISFPAVNTMALPLLFVELRIIVFLPPRTAQSFQVLPW